jgi:hypothetical protein
MQNGIRSLQVFPLSHDIPVGVNFLKLCRSFSDTSIPIKHNAADNVGQKVGILTGVSFCIDSNNIFGSRWAKKENIYNLLGSRHIKMA